MDKLSNTMIIGISIVQEAIKDLPTLEEKIQKRTARILEEDANTLDNLEKVNTSSMLEFGVSESLDKVRLAYKKLHETGALLRSKKVRSVEIKIDPFKLFSNQSKFFKSTR